MDKTELKGRLVGIDPVTDLAVVAIRSPKLSDDNVLPLGDSNEVEVGAWAIALGSPLGFEETMTVGIVSALKRQLEDEETFYTDLIQTDAAINPGNSGGPLLDVEGRVMGINTAIASPTGGFVGLGFAIPIDVAETVLDTLIRDGRVIRGWLGVGIQDLSPSLQEFYGSDRGVLVASVDPAGPARKVLQEEDVVLSIDGTPADDIFRVQSIIAAAQPGDPMRLTVLRAHRTLDVSVLTAISPRTPPAPSSTPEPQRQNLGLRVRTLGGDLASRVGLQGVKGVIIVDIESGGIAEEAGLDIGDVITRMNGKPVESDKEFATMVEGIGANGVMALKVMRDGSPRIIGLKRE
jgi:serine protease Do